MNNWKTVKLGEVCDTSSGGTPSRSKKEYWGGDIPWLGSTVCKNGFVNESSQFITENGLKNSSAKILKKGTILVALVGATIGKTAYLNFEATTNQNIAGIIPKDQKNLESKYLFYVVQSLYSKFISLSKDTFKMASLTFVRNLEIPLPPLKTQKQIVSILEKAESLKQKREETNKQTQIIIQSIFYDMFGNPVKNEKGFEIKTLLTVSSEKPKYGSGASAIPYDGKTRYIRITDVDINGNLKNSTVSSPSKSEEDYLLEEGDLLFARSGATVGKTYIHHNNNNKSIYAGYMIRFRFLKDECNPLYVYYITKTNYYLNWIASKQTQVAQPNINAKQYGDFKIPVPPLNLQNQFVKRVDKILSIQSKQQSSTKEINLLFDALMQKAFKGELVE